MPEDFITFKFTRLETQRAKDFIAKHEEEGHSFIVYYWWDVLKLFPRTIHRDFKSGKDTFTYEITPTGIGDVTEIVCSRCGKREDITEYESW